MTTPVLATVKLGAVGASTEDIVDNDFAFLAADVVEATLEGIADSIIDFYTEDDSQERALSEYLSAHLSRATNAASVNFYNLTGHLDGSPHGSPIYTKTFTLSAHAAFADYPSEVAAAISFMASGWETVAETMANPSPPPTTIRPRARYRGRIFFGPLCSVAASTSAKSEPVPGATFVADIAQAAFRFMDERGDFAVWSRADEELRLVAPDGVWWVDNAFDTQRRRGPDATLKTFVWP